MSNPPDELEALLAAARRDDASDATWARLDARLDRAAEVLRANARPCMDSGVQVMEASVVERIEARARNEALSTTDVMRVAVGASWSLPATPAAAPSSSRARPTPRALPASTPVPSQPRDASGDAPTLPRIPVYTGPEHALPTPPTTHVHVSTTHAVAAAPPVTPRRYGLAAVLVPWVLALAATLALAVTLTRPPPPPRIETHVKVVTVPAPAAAVEATSTPTPVPTPAPVAAPTPTPVAAPTPTPAARATRPVRTPRPPRSAAAPVAPAAPTPGPTATTPAAVTDARLLVSTVPSSVCEVAPGITRSTPFAVRLPAGAYELRCRNEALGSEGVFRVVLGDGETARFLQMPLEPAQ